MFVERSVNVTVNGEHPETLLALKSATGAWEIAFVENKKSGIDMIVK